MSKKEREMYEFEEDFKKFFCCCSNLSNDDNFSEARSKNGYGF